MKQNSLVIALNLVQLIGWMLIFILVLFNYALQLNLIQELKILVSFV